MAESSRLLINEQPLQALPTLARILGLDRAVILQQIQYWLCVSAHEIEGQRWIYNSYTEWAKQFPWLTDEGVRYHIRGLEKAGYLIPGSFNQNKQDKTKWYRIDYDKLEGVLKTTHGVLKTTHGVSKTTHASVENYAPLPENTIDYLTEINTTTIEPALKSLLIALVKLPYWGSGELQADSSWLVEFLIEFPDLSEQLIKECRDFHDGRRARNKGIWKNRLRNWCRTARTIKASPRRAAAPVSSRKPGEIPTDAELDEQERRLKHAAT